MILKKNYQILSFIKHNKIRSKYHVQVKKRRQHYKFIMQFYNSSFYPNSKIVFSHNLITILTTSGIVLPYQIEALELCLTLKNHFILSPQH